MEAHHVGPAATRYTRIDWIGGIASILMGGLLAMRLRISPSITMGALVLIRLLVSIPLGRAAEGEGNRQSDGD